MADAINFQCANTIARVAAAPVESKIANDFELLCVQTNKSRLNNISVVASVDDSGNMHLGWRCKPNRTKHE